MTYDDGIPCIGLGQAQKCDWIKPVNMILHPRPRHPLIPVETSFFFFLYSVQIIQVDIFLVTRQC